MIYSMTGYAGKTREVAGGSLHLELRSVNSRYLDIHFRIADDLRLLEPALREAIAARISRGKVELRLNFVAAQVQKRQLALNPDLLAQLRNLDAEVRQALPQANPLSVSDVLRWPGMLGDQETDTAALHAACLELLQEALEDFAATRAREGAKLAAVILERVVKIRDIVATVGPRIPEAQAAFQDKLKQRLAEALRGHTPIRQVLYPTLFDDPEQVRIFRAQCDYPGAIFSLDFHGGRDPAFTFLRHLRIAKNAVSLGGVETLACHPKTTTHSGMSPQELEEAGIGDGLVRVSAGIEDWRDLLADFEQALDTI